MKFGLLFRPQDPPNAANIGRRWQETLDAAQAAEEAGFDGVFVPEHHMMPDGDGWVADSLAEAERVWWPCIRAEHWFYFKQIPRWVADREPLLAGVKEESDFRFETHRI